MTVVFSAATPEIIVMTADSAVTLTIGDQREYDEGTKAFLFPQIGCVATWGARDRNWPGTWLRERLDPKQHTVADLALLVHQYLTEVYQPRERGADDVGYHVAGFHNGQPLLHHIFWGFDRPTPPNQTDRKYDHYDHSPTDRPIQFLYNGRNDLAQVVVDSLLQQVRAGGDIRYDIRTPLGLARFADFVVRFAAELTPEVGPPFTTVLISSQNQIVRIENPLFRPLPEEEVSAKLAEIGLVATSLIYQLKFLPDPQQMPGPYIAPSGEKPQADRGGTVSPGPFGEKC